MLNLHYLQKSNIGVDQGLEWDTELKAYTQKLEDAAKALVARKDLESEYLGWMDLPYDTETLEGVRQVAAQFEHFTDLIVLGIGGSSLGGITILSALQHPYHNLKSDRDGLRVHFVDNVDGDVISGLLEVLDPKTTVVNVISKSGTTTETMSAYLACKVWLEAALGAEFTGRIVATTDPKKGILRPLAEKVGYPTLSVPPSVGGRFSVFTAVGLLPAVLGKIDVEGLLRGAARAQDEFLEPAAKNPHLQAALALHLYGLRGKNMVVFMPYSSRLRFLADWFAQLWAESLGKAVDKNGSEVHSGTTPVKTLGTTDQHSQVQLYREGPNDKLFIFVKVQNTDKNTPIPNAEPDQPDMNYLEGKTFGTLMNAELAATANALADAQKPSFMWTLERVDGENLGYLMQSLMLQTAVVGELLGINAFDQPGVELGKVLTYALMGRPGYEKLAAELEAAGVKA